jgi:ABC-type transporter Mla MlaB component
MATWAWPLPAELTGAVFQFLSPHELLGAASLVCKFWQRCALEPLSWRALDVNATLAAMVAQSRLQRIAVGPAANSLVQDFVTALLKRPRRVSGLRSISFARATSSSYDLGDAALAALLIRAPQLRSLALASCSHLTDRGLAPLAALARPLPPPPLREQWAALRDGDAAVQLLRGAWRESGGAVEVEVVTEDESEYKRARAVAGGDRKEGEEDKAQGFAALRAKCPDLADAEKELAPLHFRAVCTAPWRPDDAAAPAPLLRFAACPRLQSVSLARCTQLTSKALELLAAGCPDLRSVDLTSVFQVDFAGVAALARGCRSLERLVLNGCRRVDAQCVACLAENLPALKALYLGGERAHACRSGAFFSLLSCCSRPRARSMRAG